MGAAAALGAGWRALREHGGVTTFAVVLYAAASVPLHFVGSAIDVSPSAMQDQGALLRLVGLTLGTQLAITGLIGPLVAALAVFAGLRTSQGRPGTLYDGLNFALSRYAKLFFWYLVAQICIQIGFQLVIVPGILFFQMYAFVAPVRCLEDEPWPLARSKKLTQGRRRSIFLLLVPWLLLFIFFGVAEMLGLIRSGVTSLTGDANPSTALMAVFWFVFEAIRSFYEFWMMAALYYLYEERIQRIQAAREARVSEAAPA